MPSMRVLNRRAALRRVRNQNFRTKIQRVDSVIIRSNEDGRCRNINTQVPGTFTNGGDGRDVGKGKAR